MLDSTVRLLSPLSACKQDKARTQARESDETRPFVLKPAALFSIPESTVFQTFPPKPPKSKKQKSKRRSQNPNVVQRSSTAVQGPKTTGAQKKVRPRPGFDFEITKRLTSEEMAAINLCGTTLNGYPEPKHRSSLSDAEVIQRVYREVQRSVEKLQQGPPPIPHRTSSTLEFEIDVSDFSLTKPPMPSSPIARPVEPALTREEGLQTTCPVKQEPKFVAEESVVQKVAYRAKREPEPEQTKSLQEACRAKRGPKVMKAKNQNTAPEQQTEIVIDKKPRSILGTLARVLWMVTYTAAVVGFVVLSLSFVSI